MNYLKLIGGIVLGAGSIAAAAAAVKYASDELEHQRDLTRRARKKADEDIAASKARTDEVRREAEAAIAESLRRQRQYAKAHTEAMQRLNEQALKQKAVIKIRDQALTDFENKKITAKRLTEILKENPLP